MSHNPNHALSIKTIKCTLSLALFLLLAPVTLHAIKAPGLPGLTLGVKVGYTSTLSFDDSWGNSENSVFNQLKYENANGFCFGAFARFGGKIFVQPELLYCYEKQDLELTVNNIDFNKNHELSVVDFPILLGYKIIDLKVAKISALIGPKFRINAGTEFNDNDLVNATHEDITMGLALGFDVDLVNFVLGMRYNVSPSITTIEDVNNSLDASSQTTNSFALTLGWKLL